MQQHDFIVIMNVSPDDGCNSVISGFNSDCGDLKPEHIPYHQPGSYGLVCPV